MSDLSGQPPQGVLRRIARALVGKSMIRPTCDSYPPCDHVHCRQIWGIEGTTVKAGSEHREEWTLIAGQEAMYAMLVS